MLNHSTAAQRANRVYLKAEDCRIEDLVTLCSQTVSKADYPFAADVQKNVLIYDCPSLLSALSDPVERRALMAEWSDAMLTGPGVVVLKQAEPDLAMLDAASTVFWNLIAEQNRAGSGGGDHFAKPGANDRLWNSLEKHCLADPANFARYYANPFLAAISEAWLGPLLPDDGAVERGQSGWRGAIPAPRLPPWLSVGGAD